MRTVTWRLAAVLAGLAQGMALPCLGDDIFPPCWRGQGGTTYQQWTFSTSANPAAPEQATNPYGAPQATVSVGIAGAGWINQLPIPFGANRSGIWDLGNGGSISLAIPNQAQPAGSWKYIAVQVTQFRDTFYSQLATVNVPGATFVRSQLRTNENVILPSGFPGGSWVVQQSIWLIEPCPASETVTITAGTRGAAIDQAVVDTQCKFSDGGDVFPPCWRGQSGTTFENWSFHNGLNPAAPEQKINPGNPQATVALGALALGWQDELSGFGCHQGYWDLGSSGTISLSIPNVAGSPGSYKYIRVQAVQFQDPLTYNQLATVAVPGATLVSQQQQTLPPSGELLGSWVVHQSVWRISPCSASESVVITAGPRSSLIDQVLVDTLCFDVTCPSDITAPADAGQCGRSNVTWSFRPADNCQVLASSCSPPSGSTFPVGPTTVNCTLTDGQGGTFSCSFNVTITDNQPPTIQCPPDLLVARTPPQCGATVTFTVTATDNCSGATVTCTPASGSSFPVGMTTVTCTAKDASMNMSAACTFKVTVVDFSGDAFAPCFRNRPGTTFQHWAFSTGANPATPELENNAGNPQATVTLGSLALGWQDSLVGFGCKQGYWDLGNGGTISLGIPNIAGSATSYKYVRIQVLQFQDALTYNQIAGVALTGAALVSRQQQPLPPDGELLGSWVVDVSVWRIAPCPNAETITVTASATSALIDQIVVDTLCIEPPPCQADITTVAGPGQCSALVTWTTPAVDGCVVRSVVCQTNGVPVSSPLAFAVGVTTVDCAINDAENVTRHCLFTVTVTDTQPPAITCPPTATVQCNQSIDPSNTGTPTAMDNCGSPMVTFTDSEVAGTCPVARTITRTWKATDGAGLMATCMQTINVVDTMPPTVTCPAPITVSCAGAGGSVVTFSATATDNCTANPTVTCLPASGSTFPAGPTTVNCTAMDTCGNSGSCSFLVVVVPAAADLSVSIAASPGPVTVGSNLTYKITVSNAGPCTATGVVVNNLLLPGQIQVAVTNGMGNPGMACLAQGAEGWWRGEGNANDAADSHTGTTHGGMTYAAGEVGQTFIFDGLTGYVDAPDAPGLRPASLTLEGWIKIQDPNGIHIIVSKPLGAGMPESYSIWIGSGVLYAAVADGSGSGPILSYPLFPASIRFVPSDIIDLPALAARLDNPAPADKVSQFVRSQLSPSTITLLDNYAGGPDLDLQRALARELTAIIQSGPIYDAMRFANVTLSPETQYLLARNPQGVDLVRLNRLLLQDAYPTELSHALFPPTNQWLHVAYTFDPVSQLQALYINGSLVASTFINKIISYDSHAFLIGAGNDNGVPGHFYQGGIDEVTLYGRALIGTEVQAIYNAGAGGKCLTPGTFQVGDLMNGATAMLWVVTVPTNCPAVTASATASSAATDPNLVNNVGTAMVPVNDLLANQVRLSIERVNLENDLVRICWPITCAPYRLITTSTLTPPIVWSPLVVPTQLVGPLRCTVLPASAAMQYFELVTP